MADKSKKSVAEILAAARKTDGDGSAAPPPAEAVSAKPAAEPVVAETAPAEPPSAGEASAAPAAPSEKIPASGSGRPSVAEMLAMARGDKKEVAATTPAKAAPTPPTLAKTSTAKPAAAKPAAPSKAGPVDTQSILAAARKSKASKPGPITKAEAVAKGQPVVSKARPVKEEVVVPPMPVKPAYARAATQRSKEEVAQRRAFLFGMSALAVGFVALAGTSFLWVMGTVRFMFPNILREPPNRFKVGFPDQFPPEQVQEKFKAQFGIWLVNTAYNGEQQIAALKTVCTHLGCTPNWLEAEQKFKCPCHGSGFYKDGINFEGPAPRPLERYAISISDDGQIEVDKSRIFQEEMGQWSDPASFIPV